MHQAGEGRGCQHDDGRPVLRGGTVPQAAGDAVILPVAQDDDGAVPRAELAESVQQREPQLRRVGRAPVRYRIGPQLGRALEPFVIEISQ